MEIADIAIVVGVLCVTALILLGVYATRHDVEDDL
jgi:hypothetical protein